MSTTIGIGYSTKDGSDLFGDLKTLASKYDYGLLNGLEHAESDMRLGAEIAQKHLGWRHVVLLQSPKNREVALAFGIEKELVMHAMERKPARFFKFLRELNAMCRGKCSKLSVFFSAEWDAKDRVRHCSGNMEKLIALLSEPGHWSIVFLIPETGHLQISDEIPLLFDVKLNEQEKEGTQSI